MPLEFKPRRIKRMLFHGVLLSLSIALLLSCFVYWSSDYIALHFLEEADCAAPLRILCFAFPFCGINACINGYYYGLKKASVPAFSQLLEQIIRVGAVLCLVTFLPVDGKKEGCELAVIGILSLYYLGKNLLIICPLYQIPKKNPYVQILELFFQPVFLLHSTVC